MGWVIMGKYNNQGEPEEIDCFNTKREAEKMLKEYRMSFGDAWGPLWIEKEPPICSGTTA